MSYKFSVPIVLIGIASASAIAFAAVETKVGNIKTINSTKHEIVLSSGETFEFPKTVQLKNFKAGEKVSIAYEMKNGKLMATSVEAAK
jgi:uncharacterized protein DUF1344